MAGVLGVIGGSLVGSGSSGSFPLWVQGPLAVAATTAATAHVKGAWSTLIASTTAHADMITVSVSVSASGLNTATLLDIGIGASGSEVVVVPDIACGGSSSVGSTVWSIAIPISIAAGSRVAIRAQSARTSTSVTVRSSLYKGGPTLATTAVALGTNSGTSAGISAGTSWTEIVASTAAGYSALVVCPSLSSATVTGATTPLVIGTGASGSEVEVAQIPIETTSLEAIASSALMYGIVFGSVLPGIPAGTRIVAKRATQPCDVSFIGVS